MVDVILETIKKDLDELKAENEVIKSMFLNFRGFVNLTPQEMRD